MLPLRDNVPSSRFPVVTFSLIILNVLAFFHELKLGPDAEYFLMDYGLVPVHYTKHAVSEHFTLVEQIRPFITSMFLHGGWLHLLGNMWVLWIFGDNVEDRLGRSRYLGLYLASGVAAALLHIFTNASSQVPTVGASGAIAGVMGSYFRCYPYARVETI